MSIRYGKCCFVAAEDGRLSKINQKIMIWRDWELSLIGQ